MKHFTKVVAAGVVAAMLPAGASALSVNFTILDSSTQGTGNQADVFAPNYGTTLPGGAYWIDTPNIVSPPPGNSSGNFQSPWNNTTLVDVNPYYSVQTNAGENPARLGFTELRSSFNFLWGSIDTYNQIRIGDGSDFSYWLTGSDVAAAIGGDCGDPENFECVALIRFNAGDGMATFGQFNIIEFQSVGKNALELATIPLPAAGWLLIAATGGLIAAKRRHARRAA